MERKFVGVGTSISKDENYDPMDTLLFSKDNNIEIVQVYLGYDLINNPDSIKEIGDFAGAGNITLTCHAPEQLNKKLLAENIISAAHNLLKHQKEKKLIVHFDENEPLKDTIVRVGELNKKGFSVCIENFYTAKEKDLFMKNIDTFNSLFHLAEKYDFTVYPVIDFPRLFISHIFSNYDPLVLTEQIIDNLAKHSFKVILHLIDFSDYSQHRDSWCALGKGLMPYKAIFDYARDKGIVYDHCVLEYEDKVLTLESLDETRNI